MYAHLGNSFIVKVENIVGIFDLDNSTIAIKTREYLSKKEKEKKIINISTDIPRSFIVYKENGEEKVYLSQLSTATLNNRINKGINNINIKEFLDYDS